MVDGSIYRTSEDGAAGMGKLNPVVVRGKRSNNPTSRSYANNDVRILRSISFYNTSIKGDDGMVNEGVTISPYRMADSYVTDFNETPSAIEAEIQDVKGTEDEDRITALTKRRDAISEFNDKYKGVMRARMSMIHPYALFTLIGSTDFKDNEPNVLFDSSTTRKWYEIDGDEAGGYAKDPRTSKIIDWGNSDPKGRTPYSFQDFVFCKYWNRIPNNRMITLRRYATPVFDDLNFPDYGKVDKEHNTVSNGDRYFAPVATAVTYFGEGTDNVLSELMAFSFKYNWKDIHSEKDPITTTSLQNDEGQIMGGDNIVGQSLNTGLRTISHALGFLSDMSGGQAGSPALDPRFAAANTPPDPYTNGPYENRILGPVNVIMDTYKRERGLTFTQENLFITFDYVSRPINGVNNKAIMLDLLSNIYLMGYAQGTWFGGLWRYWKDNPAVYPWKYGNVANKLYQGKILGKDGAAMTLFNSLKDDTVGSPFLSSFLEDAYEGIKALAGKLIDAVLSILPGHESSGDKTPEQKKAEAEALGRAKKRGKEVITGLEKLVARRAMSGATVPYVQNMKALLTGDAVGEWHLTIGNPLNPIAMIGNLIVKNTEITFSDELGPDDFPIGFKAKIELAHGLGRDRDAIESMFNRGRGRIYTLGEKFRTSADGETKVDEHTGTYGQNRTKADMTFAEHWGGGYNFIQKIMEKPLNNKGGGIDSSGYFELGRLGALKSNNGLNSAEMLREHPTYMVSPWMMANNL